MSSRQNTSDVMEENKHALVPKLRFLEFRETRLKTLSVIGDYLVESRISSSLNDPTKRITVRLHLQGVEHRVHRGTESTESTNNFSRKAGQFIYGKQNIHKGAFGIVPADLDGFETSQDLPCFNFKPCCYPLWFYYYLTRENVYRSLELKMTGTGSKRLNEKTFLALPIAAPEYVEQKKIADCLSSLDELIAAQGHKIEALKIHKKALMQQLFPREGETQSEFRFPEFQNNADWHFTTVGGLVETGVLFSPKDGNHGNIHPKSSDYVSQGIPFIMASDLKEGLIDIENCHFISKDQADSLKKGFAKEGDVLLSHKGTVGEVAVVRQIDTPYLMLTPQVTYYRVKNPKRLSNEFLAQLFVSDAFQLTLADVSGGGTRAYIGITAQAKLPLQLPSNVDEQQRIADSLTSLDELITAQIQKLKSLKTHKKGLMQQLFPTTEVIEA